MSTLHLKNQSTQISLEHFNTEEETGPREITSATSRYDSSVKFIRNLRAEHSGNQGVDSKNCCHYGVINHGQHIYHYPHHFDSKLQLYERHEPPGEIHAHNTCAHVSMERDGDHVEVVEIGRRPRPPKQREHAGTEPFCNQEKRIKLNNDSGEKYIVQQQHEKYQKKESQRKSYTREEKLQVVEYYRACGENKYQTGKKYNINHRTLTRWIDQEDQIRKQRAGKRADRGRKPSHPQLEEILFEEYKELRKQGCSVRQKWFRDRAIQLMKSYNFDSHEEDRFKFSKGWYEAFRRRFGINETPIVYGSFPDASQRTSSTFDNKEKNPADKILGNGKCVTRSYFAFDDKDEKVKYHQGVNINPSDSQRANWVEEFSTSDIASNHVMNRPLVTKECLELKRGPKSKARSIFDFDLNSNWKIAKNDQRMSLCPSTGAVRCNKESKIYCSHSSGAWEVHKQDTVSWLVSKELNGKEHKLSSSDYHSCSNHQQRHIGLNEGNKLRPSSTIILGSQLLERQSTAVESKERYAGKELIKGQTELGTSRLERIISNIKARKS